MAFPTANKITAGDTGRINQINDIIDDLEDLEDRKVELTGDETIAGKKTFSTVPASSETPSDDNDLVRKKFITDSYAKNVDIQTFTANGTWTKPTGAKAVFVEMWGGGSGGGNDTGTIGLAYGGGGGSYLSYLFNADDLGATETVTVGAGGAGTPVGTDNANGGLGGASTFSTITAGGGRTGGVGGIWSGSPIGYPFFANTGTTGRNGIYSGGTANSSSDCDGGSSFYGGAGGGGLYTSEIGTGGSSKLGGNGGGASRTVKGTAGGVRGGGGGAGGSNKGGGDGGRGEVRVITYF
jgi:hypothetical protein